MQGAGIDADVAELADEGIGKRLEHERGELLARIGLARRLVAAGDLPMTDVSSAGEGSISRIVFRSAVYPTFFDADVATTG